MWTAIVMLVQDLPAEPRKPIDLDAPILPLRCPEERLGEVTVCARRLDRGQRLLPTDTAIDDPALSKAEMRLFGNVRGAVEVDSATIPPGMQSNRLMFRLKAPF